MALHENTGQPQNRWGPPGTYFARALNILKLIREPTGIYSGVQVRENGKAHHEFTHR